jgi:hypothetical protein
LTIEVDLEADQEEELVVAHLADVEDQIDVVDQEESLEQSLSLIRR